VSTGSFPLAEYHLAGEAIDLVKTHTPQPAKRQRTWFSSLSECRFLAVEEPIDPSDVARRIAEIGP
jgi:tRNA A37 N6-isopentenylltransferase MiaA